MLLIVLIMGVIGIYLDSSSKEIYITPLQQKIDSLQYQISQIQIERDSLKSSYLSLEKTTDSLKNLKPKIRVRYEEKKRKLTDFTNDEHLDLFSRYVSDSASLVDQ